MQEPEYLGEIIRMSDEDSDALIGQKVTEYAELGKELAKRLAKADSDAQGYQAAAYFIKSHTPGSGLLYGTAPSAMRSLPDNIAAIANCTEVQKIIKRRQELFGYLAGMGFEPKEPPVPQHKS
jgi:hypothetical protein